MNKCEPVLKLSAKNLGDYPIMTSNQKQDSKI
jgi:hypothetical protein